MQDFDFPKEQQYSWKEVENTADWHRHQVKRKGNDWNQYKDIGDAWKVLKTQTKGGRNEVQDARRAAYKAKYAHEKAPADDPERAELLRQKKHLHERYLKLRGMLNLSNAQVMK